MIHWSKIHFITENREGGKNPELESLQFVKSSGEIVDIGPCVVTSSNFERRTRNIKIINNGEVRKIRNCTITKVNGIEIFI